MLSNDVAKKLKIDLSHSPGAISVEMADGRKAKAVLVHPGSLKIDEAEASDVEAAMLLEEFENGEAKDGLLGMSFLKQFNFHVDYCTKKVVLEK